MSEKKTFILSGDNENMSEEEKLWIKQMKENFKPEYLISYGGVNVWTKSKPGDIKVLGKRWGNKKVGYVEQYN